MKDTIVLLDEKDLDSIVGGAFNQNMIQQLGLEVKTNASGAQALLIEISYSNGQFPNQSSGSKRGVGTEEFLRRVVSENDTVNLAVKTTSGEMKTLSKSEISALLS